LDLFGPRVCSIVSILIISCGCIIFGISASTHFPGFILGMCLIGMYRFDCLMILKCTKTSQTISKFGIALLVNLMICFSLRWIGCTEWNYPLIKFIPEMEGFCHGFAHWIISAFLFHILHIRCGVASVQHIVSNSIHSIRMYMWKSCNCILHTLA
jgi:hypothetical protein